MCLPIIRAARAHHHSGVGLAALGVEAGVLGGRRGHHRVCPLGSGSSVDLPGEHRIWVETFLSQEHRHEREYPSGAQASSSAEFIEEHGRRVSHFVERVIQDGVVRAFAVVGLAALVGCADIDFGSKCGEGTTDQDGTCVPAGGSATCGEGTTQKDGVCVPDPDVTCAPGTRLEEGRCVATETTKCGEGTSLANGVCLARCGDGTTLLDGECRPSPAPVEAPDAEGMRQHACRSRRCAASLILEYWTRIVAEIDGTSWSDHALVRTLEFVETGAMAGAGSPTFESLSFVVTATTGESWQCQGGEVCPGLELEAGRPVSLTLVNPAGNLASHFLASPTFHRNVAWRSVSDAEATYRAPFFDSIGVKPGSEDRSVVLDFVPLTPGEYDGYCQLAVTDGSRYEEIARGLVTPEFSTGHAGEGMHTKIRIIDPQGRFTGHSLSQDTLLARDPNLDLDSRSSTPWWTDPARNLGRCCTDLDVELHEEGDDAYSFRVGNTDLDDANPLILTAGDGYRLTFRNSATDRSHRFTAPEFLARSVMRRAEDAAGADLRAPYLFEVEARPGHAATLSLVPTIPARYGSYCSVAVRPGSLGSVDLATGHAGSGMRAPILVVTATTSLSASESGR